MIMSTKLLLRMPFLVLAGISLVLLSIPALGVSFSDTFMGTLKVLGDVIGIVFQRELIEAAIRKALAPFAIDFHPEPYWHHAFVLLWLFNGSWARNRGRGLRGWGEFLFMIIWGGLTALVAGALTGTVPLNSEAMIIWPLAGLSAFVAGSFLRNAVAGLFTWWWPLILTGLSALLSYLAYTNAKTMTPIFGLDVPSPGLLSSASMIGASGLFIFLAGLFFTARYDYPIDNDLARLGLDIVGAFFIAFVLAIAGQYLL